MDLKFDWKIYLFFNVYVWCYSLEMGLYLYILCVCGSVSDKLSIFIFWNILNGQIPFTSEEKKKLVWTIIFTSINIHKTDEWCDILCCLWKSNKGVKWMSFIIWGFIRMTEFTSKKKIIWHKGKYRWNIIDHHNLFHLN